MKGASNISLAIYFEDFELDLDRCLLLRGGEELKLRRQSYDVLRYLAERSGQLITKDDLLAEVWAGRAVTPDSITQCLMEIRAALGDEDHSKVKTLPRRGYIFNLPVSSTKPGSRPAAILGSGSSHKMPSVALAVAGLALALILGFLALRPTSVPSPADQADPEIAPAATDTISIAVLPFVNRSNREEDVFFTDGVHDDLLATMARIGSMKVISRTSVNEYRDTVKKIPQIAQELGVGNILEGGIQRSGNQVRINVQLIDAETDEHLWANIYDRELTAENLFAVQSEITKKIADALHARLTNNEQRRIDTIATDSLEAYDAYLRGRQLMATGDSEKLKRATEEFGKATEIDPLFALAWVGLADSSMMLSDRGAYRVEDLRPVWEEAVRNALAIDAELGEAWTSMAAVNLYNKRFEDAETAFQKAIELSPNYARAYYQYSRVLAQSPMRIEEQASLGRKAAALDPNSSMFRANLGRIYSAQGLYALAEGQFQKVIELDPEYAQGYYDLAFLYMFEMSRFDKAMPLASKARKLDPQNHSYNMLLVFLYIQLGDLEAVKSVRENLVRLGAKQWQLGLVDVLIRFGKGDPADTQDAINKLVPEVMHSNFWHKFLGFITLTQGNTYRSREIFLEVEPGWLQPEQWSGLIERTRNYGCTVAWVLMNSGDPDLGTSLLQQSTAYIEESLPLVTEHPDRYFPEVCYLAAGETEKALSSIETQLAHNHLYAWNATHLMPMYDQVRDEPRYQAAVAERKRRIGVQREAIREMALEAQP